MSPEKEPSIEMHFVRHGDPDRTADTTVQNFPLLDESKGKIIKIKKDFNISESTSLGFSGNNKRSIDTVGLLVSSDRDIENSILDFENSFRVRVLDELLYKMDGNFKEFKEKLGLTDKDKKLFRVIVEKSDFFRFEEGLDFTAYSDMCNVVALYILKYSKILEPWSKVNYKYETNTLFRIFCMNEYFYPCFRTELEFIKGGELAKKKYVDWYENNFERDENRKHERQSVTIHKDEKTGGISFELIDPYGTVVFGLEELTKIINKRNEE